MSGSTSFISNVNKLANTLPDGGFMEVLSSINPLLNNLEKFIAVANNEPNINGVNANKTNIDTIVGIKDILASINADKAKYASIFADKETFDSLYADKPTLDGLFAIKTKIDSLFNDKPTLDSLYADKPTLDGLFAIKTKLDSIFTNIDSIILNANNMDDIKDALENANAAIDAKNLALSYRDEAEQFKNQAQLIAGGNVVASNVQFSDLLTLETYRNNVTNALNAISAILSSDDTNLDQMQELVNFIKLNKATLDTLGIGNIAGLQAALEAKSAELAAHANNKENPHEVTKSQIGLGNVDNTSDKDKPLSDASIAALGDKADISIVDTINQALGNKVDTSTFTQALASISSGGIRQTVSYASTDQVTGLPNFLSVEMTDISSTHDVQGDGSIVATYPLNGNANDLGGNYNATASGITYGTGKFGQCAVFNGSAYITKAVTYKSVSFWFKISSMPSSTAILCDNRDDSGDTFYGAQIDSSKISSSASALYINGVLTATGTYTPPLNEWVHVVCSNVVDSTAMTLGSRFSLDVNKFTGEIDQVRLFNRALSAAEAVMYSTETKAVAGFNVRVLATAKNIKFNCAGGDVDKEGKITADTMITGLSASAINYLYADINATSGAVTLGSTTIAPEYQKGLPNTDFPTWDTVNKGSGVTLSNGNLTATKTVAGNWANSNVYASKPIKGGKFYAEVTIGSVAGTTYGMVGISTINDYQSYYFSNTANGYAYVSDGRKYVSGTDAAYGATYTTGDNIGILYDTPTGQLTFYKNGVSQGVAFTLPANTPVYLAVAQYSTGNVTVNYGATAFTYSLPSGAIAWNAERIAGRHIFDIAAMEMWLSNGTAYDKKYRVFLAEITTSANAVANIICYALNGKYESATSAITMSSTTNYAHNLGCRPKNITLKAECVATNLGYQVGEVVELIPVNYSDNSGYTLSNVNRNSTTLTLASLYLYLVNKTTFILNGITTTNWKKFIEVDRGW